MRIKIRILCSRVSRVDSQNHFPNKPLKRRCRIDNSLFLLLWSGYLRDVLTISIETVVGPIFEHFGAFLCIWYAEKLIVDESKETNLLNLKIVHRTLVIVVFRFQWEGNVITYVTAISDRLHITYARFWPLHSITPSPAPFVSVKITLV